MRNCAKCGAPMPVETGRGRRRKSCESCSPSRPRRKPEPPAIVSEVVATPVGSVTDATKAALTSAGKMSTPMGQAALVLARRIDLDEEPVAAIAQAVKQLRETLASIIPADSTAPATADPNDEFTRKRLAREHGA